MSDAPSVLPGNTTPYAIRRATEAAAKETERINSDRTPGHLRRRTDTETEAAAVTNQREKNPAAIDPEAMADERGRGYDR